MQEYQARVNADTQQLAIDRNALAYWQYRLQQCRGGIIT